MKPVNELVVSGNMVKIFVGPKRKEWVIHEDLICDRSDYFKAVFKDGFKETDEKEIHLDDDPAAFALFVDWIYGAELRSNNAQSEWSHVQDLGALWVFADKIRLPEVKNEVCLLYDVYLKRRFVDVEEVRSIYRNTLEASGLRRSVARSTVDFYLNVANKDRELEHFLKIIGSNATFGLDVARELKSRIRMRN